MKTPTKYDLWPTFSDREFRRRHKILHDTLIREDLDCFIIVGRVATFWTAGFHEREEDPGYILFPRSGEPTQILWAGPTHSIVPRMLSVIKDLRSGGGGLIYREEIAKRIDELKLNKGRFGIIGRDRFAVRPEDTMPAGHLDYLKKKFPKATFKFFTRLYTDLSYIKSHEEIEMLRGAGHIADLVTEDLAKKVKPGMTEYQLDGIANGAAHGAQGEIQFVFLGSSSMKTGGICFPNVITSRRRIRRGDIIIYEIGCRYGGYTTQVGKPIAMGRPTKYYRDLFDVAKESYDNIVDQLRVGKTLEDVQSKGGAPLIESGFSLTQTPLIHGLGVWNEEPRVSIDSIRFDGPFRGKFKFRSGMTFSVQPNPVSKDRRFGLFLADTYAVTDNGPLCLMKDPMRLIEV